MNTCTLLPSQWPDRIHPTKRLGCRSGDLATGSKPCHHPSTKSDLLLALRWCLFARVCSGLAEAEFNDTFTMTEAVLGAYVIMLTNPLVHRETNRNLADSAAGHSDKRQCQQTSDRAPWHQGQDRTTWQRCISASQTCRWLSMCRSDALFAHAK